MARLNGEAPESKPTIPPVINSAIDTKASAQINAGIPVRPQMNGITGMIAPDEKKRNEENATFQGLPPVS